jgi:ribokinase
MAPGPRIAVLGSLNMDISVGVDRLPVPGATVLGSAARFAPGGKGANQAVAAARLGGSVLMAGCVGDDAFGAQLLAALRDEGVDTGGVREIPAVPSGIAMITIDADGENMITVAPGANARAGDAEVQALRDASAVIVVVSAEIPVATIRSACAGATAGVLLNLAPAPEEAAEIIAAGIDWLVVNESEAASVIGHPVEGLAAAAAAAAKLAVMGPRNVVVTAGAAGAAMAGHAGAVTVPGFRVSAVDAVGAGDAFVGALALMLAEGIAPGEAVRAAAAAAATAATRAGAQPGMPRPADVAAATGYPWQLGA